MTEDEMVRWHHWLNRYESDQTPGDDEGQDDEVDMFQSTRLQRVRQDLVIKQQQQQFCFVLFCFWQSCTACGMWNFSSPTRD